MVFFRKDNDSGENSRNYFLSMFPVSTLATAFYYWEIGLPDMEYPSNWIWGIIYFVISLVFINFVFCGVFSIVGKKENPKIIDCVKTTAGVLAVFLVFVFLVESR